MLLRLLISIATIIVGAAITFIIWVAYTFGWGDCPSCEAQAQFTDYFALAIGPIITIIGIAGTVATVIQINGHERP